MSPTGTLYIVATPIGNPEDITLRALRILGEADRVAAEDTRETARLLSRHGIKARLVSFHEHNEAERSESLIRELEKGVTIALVSDAGTPSVSDPGFRLVRAAVEKGIPVVPVPGPSAAVTALSASGLPTDAFTFLGFPPRKQGKRQELLRRLKETGETIIFYDSPRRITTLLREIIDTLGDRDGVLCREMTKPHEEFLRGPLSSILKELSGRSQVKGECTLLIGGGTGETISPADIRAEIEHALNEKNASVSVISKRIARKYGVSRNDIYAEALSIQQERKENG